MLSTRFSEYVSGKHR